jgi:hypothetical protein
MAVNTEQAQITPYTSSVPLVQIPPQAMEQETRPAQPLQGEFGKKGTGALAIGDSVLKGLIAGHQMKAERHNAQAQATINAADAAANAAYQQYQDALSKAGGNQQDANAQAAYQEYQKTFQAGKEAKAKFVIPEKPQKGQSGQQKKGEKGEKKTGWSNFKDFFEANPHIVPQIALLSMQPKPPGVAPDTQQQIQATKANDIANQTAQQKQQNEKAYQEGYSTFAHLSQQDVAALPPESKKQYEAWNNARAALLPMKYTGASKLYALPGGEQKWLNPDEANQLYPDAKPVDTTQPKLGTPGADLAAYAKEIGKDPKDLTWDEIQAAKSKARAAQTPGSTTTSTSTVDTSGDRTTTTTRKATPGGVQPPPKGAAAATGGSASGITPPPQSGKAQTGAAKGGVQPPPTAKKTQYTEKVAREAVATQQKGYKEAETQYSKAVEAADKAFAAAQEQAVKSGDQSILQTAQQAKDRAIARAKLDLDEAKSGVAKTYDAAIKSIGGTTGSDKQNVTADNPPQGATAQYRDPKTGKVVGYAVNGQYVAVTQ